MVHKQEGIAGDSKGFSGERGNLAMKDKRFKQYLRWLVVIVALVVFGFAASGYVLKTDKVTQLEEAQEATQELVGRVTRVSGVEGNVTCKGFGQLVKLEIPIFEMNKDGWVLDVVAHVPDDTLVEVLDEDEYHYQIKFGDDVGWIRKKYATEIYNR